MKSAFLVVVCGLSVHTRMQTLDKGGNVVPGLYAVGNVGGDFFGGAYPTIFPGHSHGRALTFGRLAGQYAAEEAAASLLEEVFTHLRTGLPNPGSPHFV